MLGTVMFVILGYLSGSVLYARVFSHVFRKEGMLEQSRDGNPGTANAFLYGGFWCGFLTLLGDLLKGFLPVFLFWHADMPEGPRLFWNGLVIAAPVIGHAFPLFYGGRGGKGIAVTFGCLLGLLPLWRPVAALAVFFLFFSVADHAPLSPDAGGIPVRPLLCPVRGGEQNRGTGISADCGDGLRKAADQ